MTKAKQIEQVLNEALRLNKIGFVECRVIGSFVHVSTKHQTSANKIADILANFCESVKVYDGVLDIFNPDTKQWTHKMVVKVCGRI